MLEVVIDSILLHQPTHESKVALAILNTIFDLVVVAGGTELEVRSARKSGIREHLLNDVLDVLLEKDLAVGTVIQQPEPRAQHQAVARVILLVTDFAAGPLRVGEDAAENALLLLIGLQPHRARLAKRLVEIDILLLAQRIDLNFERLTQSLNG